MCVIDEKVQGLWLGARGGGEKVLRPMVVLGSQGSGHFFDVGLLMIIMPQIVWRGHDHKMHLDLFWLLNMMVPSKRSMKLLPLYQHSYFLEIGQLWRH
jgi:hypothetical protein